jgi:hypothetical protein
LIVGLTQPDDKTASAVMKVGEVKILTNTECENQVEKLHGSKVPVHYRYLCTAAEPYVLIDHVSITIYISIYTFVIYF